MFSRCYLCPYKITNDMQSTQHCTLPEQLHIKHLAKCLIHSECSVNFMYYFYCLLPLINHNINQADKIRKKFMRGNLFIHSDTLTLLICVSTYCYIIYCTKGTLQKSHFSLLAPLLKNVYSFKRVKCYFLNTNVANTFCYLRNQQIQLPLYIKTCLLFI